MLGLDMECVDRGERERDGRNVAPFFHIVLVQKPVKSTPASDPTMPKDVMLNSRIIILPNLVLKVGNERK